ncbi:MAG: amino acid decarboxylase [Phycisphaerae bacterium]|jgi:aromatic-L-amino-acid decarboxylase
MQPPANSAPSNTPPGDLSLHELQAGLARVAALVSNYVEQGDRYPVLPRIKPGEIKARLAASPPNDPEPLDRILDDYQQLIEPNVTHWNHPGFLAYFAITGSGPGILGETLAAALNVNAMLWRTGPAATELEETVCDWLRQMIDLPPVFKGHINDTASIASLLALAAARQRGCGDDLRQRGLAGRTDLPALTVYASEHAHSSIDKAVITLGLGLENLRRIPADEAFRLDPRRLDEAIRADRAAGKRPIGVVATVGTTSSTSIDPVDAVADICERERLWLHVDAAYAGSAAICPEYRKLVEGLERADSIVLNPHKWLFTPTDCSVLLTREPDTLRRAFSVVPEYLRTTEIDATNLMDYGVQLGRRFRALKLWFVLRAFGRRGLQERIRYHCALARQLAGWIECEPGFELAAPVPFSTVCFRAAPAGMTPEGQDAHNEALLERVNAAGPVLLSHTKLRGRLVLRVAIGNIRTSLVHIETAWKLVKEADRALRSAPAARR